MIFSRAKFEKLSDPMQALVLALLPVPLYVVFAIAGDSARGAMAWIFAGALLIALHARGETKSFRRVAAPAAVLLALHIPVVIWDPLRHAPFFGGIITPIATVDYCVDYAFLWLWRRVFKDDSKQSAASPQH